MSKRKVKSQIGKLELRTLADFEKAGWSVEGDVDEVIIAPTGDCYYTRHFIGNSCPVCSQYEEDNPSSDEEATGVPCLGHSPELQAEIKKAILYHSLLQKRNVEQLEKLGIIFC